MCKAHFRKGGESRRQVRNSESCFAPRRAGKRERPPEELRRSDERRGRALAPPRHKNAPSHSNFSPHPKRSPPEGTSPPLCSAKRLVSPSSATAAAFSIPAISPTPINAAIRTPARRSALGFAERGRRRLSPKRGSAFQAKPRAAPSSPKNRCP